MKSWREASTLILAALNKSPVNSKWNYELLTLTRSSTSSFMPNGQVFPGGTTEEIDSNKGWLDFFSSFHGKDLKITGEIPPILQNETGEIPKLMSLKITAIRETFEETGILLGCFKDEVTKEKKCASFINLEGLDVWRGKVQEDSSNFLSMCQNYNCCPDIFNLHLWSNWLTPTSRGKKRFDTAFFIGCLDQKPVAAADNTEIEKLSWVSPEKLLESYAANKIWLPPPQVYEISRLLQFQDVGVLNDFAINRSVKGCERWMPVHIKTSDGLVSILPGDDAYKSPDYHTLAKPAEVQMTREEFRKQSNVLHRMEFPGNNQTEVVIMNYSPTAGHVVPQAKS